jgi:hypothetical protein
MATPTTTLSALQLVTPMLPNNTNTLSTDSSVLPIVVNADDDTIRVEVGVYNTVYATDSYIVVGTAATGLKNQFSFSIPLTLTVQETNVQIVGRNYDPTNFPNGWAANTAVPPGFTFADPNGNSQSVLGVLSGNPLAFSATGGITGATQPTWATQAPANITNVSLTANVLTVTAANTFAVGKVAWLTGLTNATFLNGTLVTVTGLIGPGPTYSGFTAAVIRNTNYASAADTGEAQAATVEIAGALGSVVWANVGAVAITPTVKFALLAYQSNLALAIAPPSGISAAKNQTDCLVQWVTPDYPGFIGVRVMISTDPSGVNPPYTQFGDLVSAVSSTAQTIINSQSNTATNVAEANITAVALLNNLLTVAAANTFTPGTVVEIANLINATFLNGETVTVLASTPAQFTASYTGANYPAGSMVLTLVPDSGQATSIVSTTITMSTNTVMETQYSTVEVPFSSVNSNIFYAMLSTVIQDPQTNVMYESVQNGPLQCGYVNLQLANPTDFPVLQRKEDIAARLIIQILKQMPNLDLSPRSEIRDMFVDPWSIEAANMSVREWFARVSTSISAISQLDCTTGTGVSSPFQSSPYKQQIARAYGLSAVNTQNLINEQFDLLGEQAGLTRLGTTSSTVVLTFYTYTRPTSSITIPEGAVVATSPDANTSSLNFVTQGQGTIDFANLASFYNSQTGWWGVSVPAQCTQAGSVGNVGAGTIRTSVSGVPTGTQVTNLVGANYGTDQEVNSAFAARIQARLVTGIDSSSRNGYLVAALSTPGVIGAQVVGAGDLEMLRDWDPTRQKHVYGCVDVYVRGTTLSQQDEFVPFEYPNNGTYGVYGTYSSLIFPGTGLAFQIQGFSNLAYPPYDGVELLISRATGSFYLGLDRAQFVGNTIVVNANDLAYQYVGSGTTYAKVPLVISSQNATNAVALTTVSGAQASTYTFQLFLREASPFIHQPALQPILQVYSVTGEPVPGGTGTIPSALVGLVHTSDFLLNGGSNDAGDLVEVALQSVPVTSSVMTGPSVSTPVLIAMGMAVPLDGNGNPTNVTSVLSADQSTLYVYGTDYAIAPMGPYHQYGVQPLTSSVQVLSTSVQANVLTVNANNEFGVNAHVTFSGLTASTFLNGQTVTITAATPTSFQATFITGNYATTLDTGFATGSAIQANQTLSVTYNQFSLYERLTFVSAEQQVLSGTLPTTLDNDGFVHDTWLPQSYTTGIPTLATYPSMNGYQLILDGWDGSYGADGGLDIPGSLAFDPSGLVGNAVPYASRYIKVTFFNGVQAVVMKENIDFTLSVDSASGAATLTRIPTGHIPDGGTVSVSYFITETFTFSTQYPTFVQVLANSLALTQSAGASVEVKAMVANDVDITLAVTLDANTSPETIDPVIRTVINIVLDNAVGTLYQSALIQQVQSITGVQSVEVPLIRCAKSNGSYDIGVVIPTGTAWIPLNSDPLFAAVAAPQNSWITVAQALPDTTIPSGGAPDVIVDMLYEGQVFVRATSVNNFLATALSVPHLAVEPFVTDTSPGSFYIIGQSDSFVQGTSTVTIPNSYSQRIIANFPQDVINPGTLNYFCTYQVFNEVGATDVTVSPTEYLAPGVITLTYISNNS